MLENKIKDNERLSEIWKGKAELVLFKKVPVLVLFFDTGLEFQCPLLRRIIQDFFSKKGN